MEERIKRYEKIIAEESQHPSREIWELHRETVHDFQHERMAHLFVMLFFVLLTLGALGVDALWAAAVATPGWSILQNVQIIDFEVGFWSLWPMHLLVIILLALSIAYIRHYYFLENHIQSLYDYNETLCMNRGRHRKEEKDAQEENGTDAQNYHKGWTR